MKLFKLILATFLLFFTVQVANAQMFEKSAKDQVDKICKKVENVTESQKQDLIRVFNDYETQEDQIKDQYDNKEQRKEHMEQAKMERDQAVQNILTDQQYGEYKQYMENKESGIF
jgi:hypothetical protein